jgi:hypothetical protein
VTVLVEQLHYTWAARGVEGANRLQIAAMSPGLKSGPAAEAMPMVRRICRYDPPRGAGGGLPVSFGWLDHESHRIAFRRVGLPAAMGKRGNFAAHLLVAPPDALPEAAVAALFGSPFWWDGPGEGEEDPSLELPTIALDQVPVAEAKPEAEELRAGVALAYHVFTKPEDSRLAVAAPAEEVGRAARAMALIAPEALAGLSFSTYEGRPVFPFDLLGSEAREPGMTCCALSLPEDLDDRGLATLSRLAEDRRLASTASRIARREGGSGASAIWQAARRIVGLGSGEEDGGNLLGDAGVVGFICATAEGRAGVAAAVQRGRPAVVAAVAAATAEMGEEEAGALAAAIAARYREARTATGWAAAQSAFPAGQARELLADAVLDLVRGDPEAAATLGDEDAALILAIAAGRGNTVAEVCPALRGSRSRIAACAREAKVPAAYLAAMFEIGLGDPSVWASLGRAVGTRPALLDSVSLDGAEADRCIELLGRFDLRTREAALGPLLPQLFTGPAASRVAPLLMSLPPVIAAETIASARPRGLPRSEELDGICDALGAILLDRREPGPARRLLGESSSPDGELATALLRRLDDGGGGGPAAIAVEAGGLQRTELRRALRRLALDHSRAAARSLGAVEALWDALKEIFRQDDDAGRLKRLLGAGTSPPAPAAAMILAWIAGSLLDRESDLVNAFGSLKDRDLDAAALAVAESVEPWRFAEVGPLVEGAPKRARKWWGRLESQADKAQRRNR